MAETSSLLRSRTHYAYRGFESLPLRHSFLKNKRTKFGRFCCAAVAQLDRVPGYEPGGRRFESSQPRHIKQRTPPRAGFFVCVRRVLTGFEPREVRPKRALRAKERRSLRRRPGGLGRQAQESSSQPRHIKQRTPPRAGFFVFRHSSCRFADYIP